MAKSKTSALKALVLSWFPKGFSINRDRRRRKNNMQVTHISLVSSCGTVILEREAIDYQTALDNLEYATRICVPPTPAG